MATTATKAATKPEPKRKLATLPTRAQHEVGQSTKRANSAPIDYGAARMPSTFTNQHSPWINKVCALVADVVQGVGTYDAFYKIGSFTTPSGARTTIRNLSKQAELFPANPVTFEVELVTRADGTKGSELWAAVRQLEP